MYEQKLSQVFCSKEGSYFEKDGITVVYLLIRSNDEDIVCCTGINVYECLFKFWDRLVDACVGTESMDLFWKTI